MSSAPFARGMGCVIEGAKVTSTRNFATMRLPTAGDLREFSLEKFVPAVLDQGMTSSCVAHAFASGIHVAECRAGLPYAPVSRRFAYYQARLSTDGPQMTDSGTTLRACADGLRKLGAPDEADWKWAEESADINRRPSFKAIGRAHPRRGGEYVKIYDTGADRLAAVKSALVAGHAVAFGTALAKSFLESTGSAIIDVPTGESTIGSHAMLVIGWHTASGHELYRVLNSWGAAWRDGGLCWLSADYVKWAFTEDLHVIHGWERIKGAA